MPYFGGPIRSPETKEEIKQAVSLLTALGVVFSLVALLGAGATLAYDDPEYLILTGVCGGVSMLLFSASAYNRYYMRRMAHAPIVTAALRHPAVTVGLIIAGITALVSGIIFLLIFSRR